MIKKPQLTDPISHVRVIGRGKSFDQHANEAMAVVAPGKRKNFSYEGNALHLFKGITITPSKEAR